jgi:hypothetical protein
MRLTGSRLMGICISRLEPRRLEHVKTAKINKGLVTHCSVLIGIYIRSSTRFAGRPSKSVKHAVDQAAIGILAYSFELHAYMHIPLEYTSRWKRQAVRQPRSAEPAVRARSNVPRSDVPAPGYGNRAKF